MCDEPVIVTLDAAASLKTLAEVDRELSSVIRCGHPTIIAVGVCEAVDSRTLSGLHVAARRARRAGQFLAVVCPSPELRRLLDLIGLTDTLRVQSSVEAAHEAFRRWGDPDRTDA